MYGVYVCVWAHVKMATKTGDITPGLSTRGRGGEGAWEQDGDACMHMCVWRRVGACVSMYIGVVHVT